MSAWDITGAIIFSFIAGVLWLAFWCYMEENDFTSADFPPVIMTICFSACAIFCISRCFGAHL